MKTVSEVSIFRHAIIKNIALNMFLHCSTIVTPIMVGICLVGVRAPMLAQTGEKL